MPLHLRDFGWPLIAMAELTRPVAWHLAEALACHQAGVPVAVRLYSPDLKGMARERSP